MSFQTGSIDKNGLARTEDGKLYVTSVGTASITGGSIGTGTTGLPTLLSASSVAASGAADTNENTLATVAVAGNLLGANGKLRITFLFTVTNSANNKTLRVRFGGTQFFGVVLTTSASYVFQFEIGNRGATNSQVSGPSSWGANTAAVTTGAIDTTASQNLTITGQKASAGETITLEGYTVEVIH
jgi:hypothetical protein